MIDKDQAIPLLLEGCPSFGSLLTEHLVEYGDDLPYVVAGTYARHLLELHQAGRIDSLVSAGDAIERLHLEGSPWVKEFATVGILEGVQNAWSNAGVQPEEFFEYLGPESRRWWSALNEFWAGKAPVVQVADEE